MSVLAASAGWRSPRNPRVAGNRRLARPVVPLLAAVLASACGDGGDSPPAPWSITDAALPEVVEPADDTVDAADLAAKQVLHRGNGEEPDTLDPHLVQGVPASNIVRDLFEGLVAERPDGRLVPGAASHWRIGEQGRVYTFHLRADARWSNGDPVTAADFVYGLRRSLDPQTGSRYVQVLSPILNADRVASGRLDLTDLGVKAPDDTTVRIELGNPTPYFLNLLTHPATFPVHRESVERLGRGHARPGTLVSNGAFRLAEWKMHSHIALERNPHYRDSDSVHLRRVVYYPVSDQYAEFNRFRAGDLHWTYEVPASQFSLLRERFPRALQVSPWLGTYYFGFNLTRAPFRERPRLRRALSLAVDRKLLAGKVTRFGELPSFTLVPPGIPGYTPPRPDYAEWSQNEREAEALDLYRAAGYSRERPLRVELRYNSSDNHKKIALAVAAMWRQVLGVETTLINEEWKVFLQNRAQKRVTEVYRSGWIGDYADPYTFLQLFQTGHGQNHTGYTNPDYDRLLRRAEQEIVNARRQRLLREAERLLLQDQPLLPLYTYVTKRLVSPQVGGWAPNIMDHHYSKHMYMLRAVEQTDNGAAGRGSPPAADDVKPEAPAVEGQGHSADAQRAAAAGGQGRAP